VADLPLMNNEERRLTGISSPPEEEPLIGWRLAWGGARIK